LESGIELVSKIELRLRVIVEQGALLVWHESLNAPLESSAYEYQEILREGEEKGYRVADPPPNYTGTWTRYGPDGRKLDEKDYVNGRLQGRVTLYGGKEQKCREFYVIDGQRHGTMTQWNHKGEIIDVSEWVAGTGTYRIYYSSGQLSSEQQMRRGELHGVARYWNGKGELTCTEYYEDGELIRLEGKPRPGHHRAFQSAPKCGKKAGP
jgi:antitoxin component YwqK of YwqJK toxin-antitoxin module